MIKSWGNKVKIFLGKTTSKVASVKKIIPENVVFEGKLRNLFISCLIWASKKIIQPSFAFPPFYHNLYRLLIATSTDQYVTRILFAHLWRLRHRCFPMNFAKFFQNSGWLLLRKQDRAHFWIYLLNRTLFSFEIWPTNRNSHVQYF